MLDVDRAVGSGDRQEPGNRPERRLDRDRPRLCCERNLDALVVRQREGERRRPLSR